MFAEEVLVLGVVGGSGRLSVSVSAKHCRDAGSGTLLRVPDELLEDFEVL